MDVTVQPRILLARRGPHLWARAAGVRLSLSIASEELHRKGSPSWGVIRVWAHPGQMQNTGGCQDSQQRKVSFFPSPSSEHEVPPKKKKKNLHDLSFILCYFSSMQELLVLEEVMASGEKLAGSLGFTQVVSAPKIWVVSWQRVSCWGDQQWHKNFSIYLARKWIQSFPFPPSLNPMPTQSLLGKISPTGL